VTPVDDPGGQLLVTPAGGTMVSTDALLASADRLRTLERALHDDVRRVVAADAIPLGRPLADTLVPILDRVRARCESARDAFGRAADEYTRAEGAIERIQRDLAALLAATVGPVVLGLLARLVVLAPHLLAAGALLGWAAIPDSGDGRLETVKRFLLEHPELITSPEFVRFVSLVATSIDDGVLGLAGVPLLAGLQADDGVAGGAMTVTALGMMLGLFRETPVRLDGATTVPINTPPSGVRERLDRIPEGDQVRIEKYEADGLPPRYVVYVGPTETFSPLAGGEPWDQTSNMYGVAGLSPGSFRAVELAMHDAGIAAGDEVVVTGFSQGGLIATMVAASGDWNVVGLETHGAPAGNIPLPDGIAGMAVRNTDDLVPALAGPQRDHSVLQVERQAFRDGAELPTDQAAPAHQRTAYERTADAIDGAESAAVREQVRALDAFTAEYLELPGGHATRTTYHAVRVP
jgi:hypothetical protein